MTIVTITSFISRDRKKIYSEKKLGFDKKNKGSLPEYLSVFKKANREIRKKNEEKTVQNMKKSTNI